jgi:hypothetical protein
MPTTVPVTDAVSTRSPSLKSASRKRYTPATVSAIISLSAKATPRPMNPPAVPRLAATCPRPTIVRSPSATPNHRNSPTIVTERSTISWSFAGCIRSKTRLRMRRRTVMAR